MNTTSGTCTTNCANVKPTTYFGNEITSRRTSAASALAESYLARKDASRMTLLGAERVGSVVPQAYRAVLPIREVGLWDAAPAASEQLTARLAELGFARASSTICRRASRAPMWSRARPRHRARRARQMAPTGFHV